MSYKLTAEQMEKYDGFDCRPASDPQNPIKAPQYLQDLIAKRKADAAALASSQASDVDGALEKSGVAPTVAVEKKRVAYDVSLSSDASRHFNDFILKLIASKEERKKNKKKRKSRLEYLKEKRGKAFAKKLSSGEAGEDRLRTMLSKAAVKSSVSLVGSVGSGKNKKTERYYNNMKAKNFQSALRVWMNKRVYWSQGITDRTEVGLGDDKINSGDERDDVKNTRSRG